MEFSIQTVGTAAAAAAVAHSISSWMYSDGGITGWVDYVKENPSKFIPPLLGAFAAMYFAPNLSPMFYDTTYNFGAGVAGAYVAVYAQTRNMI